MATDKLIGENIFDWYYPEDIQNAKDLIVDLQKYIDNPKNAKVLGYLIAQKHALELLLTLPLQ